MKTFFKTAPLLAGLFIAACSQADAPKTVTTETSAPAATEMATDVMSTKTKAVLVYADWCGSCKVLDPKVQKAKSMGQIPGLDFVTLDYTNKDPNVFYAQADEAGVGEAVRTYLDGTIKTGLLLLVDVDDQAVIGKVTKSSDPAEIVTALKDAVAAS